MELSKCDLGAKKADSLLPKEYVDQLWADIKQESSMARSILGLSPRMFVKVNTLDQKSYLRGLKATSTYKCTPTRWSSEE